MFTLFLTFLKIGAFTFGGGYAMLALVEREILERRHWMSDADYRAMLAIVPSLPGIFAVNIALFVGYRIGGRKGSLLAALGAALPSIIIILLIAGSAMQYKDHPAVLRVFMGLRPCVVALILCPALSMAQRSLKWQQLWIPLAGVALIAFLHVSPLYIVLAAILWGLAAGIRQQKKEAQP